MDRDGLRLLVLNPGSSSLKWAVFRGALDEQAGGEEALPSGPPAIAEAVGRILARLDGIDAVGVRVVHGGARLTRSVRVDEAALAEIRRAAELAPLHDPVSIAALAAVGELLPCAPRVAVFDTAFFAELPMAERLYPLPWSWYADWGIRRYGFHGLSHAYCAGRARELLGERARRAIVLHLGSGCSASAVEDGRPLATTMGFTPLDGLAMATRPGTLDPGILLHVLRRSGLGVDALEETLQRGSGLLGLSGVSADAREIARAAADGDERARLALQLFSARARSAVGALAVTLGGVDALVFTAGIGEHDAALRAEICRGLGCLGLELSPSANAAALPDLDVATAGSRGRILVLRTREELQIAREVIRLVG